MSICPDDGSCDDCLPVHTFSGLGGQNALENFCKWAFDHPVNEWAVFIEHNSSNYDAHFILSYHVMNTSWPSWDVISMDVRRALICQQ